MGVAAAEKVPRTDDGAYMRVAAHRKVSLVLGPRCWLGLHAVLYVPDLLFVQCVTRDRHVYVGSGGRTYRTGFEAVEGRISGV